MDKKSKIDMKDSLKKKRSKFISFFQRQLRTIRRGGLSVLFGKCWTLLLMVLAVPVVLLVRLMRPFLIIRFGQLASRRLGHFAANTELYLCKRDLGLYDRRTFDIFYHTYPISNYQLKKMWERTLHVFRFVRELSRVNLLLPGGRDHVVEVSTDKDVHGLFAQTNKHLSFTSQEERRGQEALRGLGIENGTRFVCFHARDPAYLDSVLPNSNWSYHNHRDSNIHNCIPAIEELTHRGYFAIRMGAVVNEALSVNNPRIIDYAVNGREDFLDVYLGAKCRFFICTTAGIHGITLIFRCPIAWVNYIPLKFVETWGKNDLTIPKKLWLREERRFLTFREICDSEIGGFTQSEQYEKLGIEPIENTPEEINALVVNQSI